MQHFAASFNALGLCDDCPGWASPLPQSHRALRAQTRALSYNEGLRSGRLMDSLLNSSPFASSPLAPPSQSSKDARRRRWASRSLWQCCAMSDGPGVEAALSHGADAKAKLAGPTLERIGRALRHKVSLRELDQITPLALCARMGGLRGFEALNREAGLNGWQDRTGALRMAIASRSIRMARRALEMTAKKEIKLDHGALTEAAAWGRQEIIDALIQLGADPNERAQGSSPMIRAAERAMPWALRRLAKAGASVEARRESDGASALMIAADRGGVEMMALVLELGASLEAVDKAGRSALHRVALARDAAALRWLAERGAHLDALCPTERLTPLGRAIRSGNLAGVSTLLAAGANPHDTGPGKAWRPGAPDPRDAQPLNLFGAWMLGSTPESDDSRYNDRIASLGLAIASDADMDAKTPRGDWPLRHALLIDDQEKKAARALLGAGASTEVIDDKGDTLLETMVLYHLGPRRQVGQRQVEALLDHGARVTPRLLAILADDSWKSGYSYDLHWLDRLQAAALRQREAEALEAIASRGRSIGPKRV